MMMLAMFEEAAKQTIYMADMSYSISAHDRYDASISRGIWFELGKNDNCVFLYLFYI